MTSLTLRREAMRVLAVTKIFPNALEPLEATHIRQQCAALSRHCDVRVMATIPWFPGAGWLARVSAAGRQSAAGRLSRAPRDEVIEGLPVSHPRFLYLPKMALSLQGPLYAASVARSMYRLRDDFDVIFATWAHPDAVAATMLGRALDKPVVGQVIGSDINVLSRRAGARIPMQLVLPHADRMIAVSRQLADGLTRLGVARDRVDVIPTGVNMDIFRPRSRRDAQASLPAMPVCSRLAVYVGRLERAKGVLDLLDAYAGTPEQMGLAIVGDGSARGEVEARAQAIGPRVAVVGNRPLDEVARWLAASDVLTLPSWDEGTPNVVIEALASGRRVVATDVGGIPDLLPDPMLGTLVAAHDVAGLRAALIDALATDYEPEAVRAAAPILTWDESARRILRTLEAARYECCTPLDRARPP